MIISCSLNFDNTFLSVPRGYEQQEVTCNPNIRDKSAFWSIEDNRYPRCKRITHLTFYVL